MGKHDPKSISYCGLLQDFVAKCTMSAPFGLQGDTILFLKYMMSKKRKWWPNLEKIVRNDFS